MFERYDINNLYVAEVSVRYPMSNEPEINVGNIFTSEIIGYGYYTVLLKKDDEYLDLANHGRKVDTEVNPLKVSYVIDHIEPLSKYYEQSGKKKLNKRKSLVLANQCFGKFNIDRVKKLREQK